MKMVLFSLFGLLLLFFIIALTFYILTSQKHFGSVPQGESLKRIEQSPNYRDGAFQNLIPTPMALRSPEDGEKSRARIAWEVFFGKKERAIPQGVIPIEKNDLFSLKPDEAILIWLGHSSYFIQLAGKRILVDPILSDYAAPFSFLNRAFEGTTPYGADDFPEIDYLLITHDHWDHLDYETILSLKGKVKKVITPLGVGSHLLHWKYESERVHELDWYEQIALDDALLFHAIPARHYSGRSLKRAQTLWAGYVIEGGGKRILIGGDSGYGPHYKEIGDRFDGFDLVMLDSGQYNKRWGNIHMHPHEAAQAAQDLKADALLPGHIGRFSLAYHAWDEPFIKITEESKGKSYRLVTPKIGEKVRIGDREQKFGAWWLEVEK